jgi:hypothetical protein
MTTRSASPSESKLSPRTTNTGRRAIHVSLPWALLAAGLLSWGLSLRAIGADGLGPWGMLPELPVAWYMGLALTSAVAVHTTALQQVVPRGLAVAALASMTLILYATTILVEDAPRQAWTYKHIGVTRYIVENGSLDPSIDIYQRWPGGFALGAVLSQASGVDLLRLAEWAPVFFMAVLSSLLFGLAKTLSSSDRSAFVAVLVFTCTNWTGQTYYAPQPVALALHLGTILLFLRWFRSEPNSVGSKLERILSPGERPSPRATRRPLAGPLRRTTACIMLLHVASTLTHQLTAWVTVGSLLLLGFLGYLRCWRLIAALSAVTAAYLAAHLRYVEENYGIIEGLNPLENYRPRVEAVTPLVSEKAVLGSLALYLSLVVGLLALYGLWSFARRSQAGHAAVCAALIGSPLLLGVLQSYGGEAQARAFLLASPWCAIAVGWGVLRAADEGKSHVATPGRRSRHRSAAGLGAVSVLLLSLLVPVQFGNEDVYRIPRSEVEACELLASSYPDGVTFVLSVPGFPVKCSGDYDEHVGPFRGDTPSLISTDPGFAARDFATDVARSVDIVWDYVDQYGRDSLLVFSTSQAADARAWNIFGGTAGYERLEEAVASSSRFRLVYENRDTRVYELVQEIPSDLVRRMVTPGARP